MGTQIHPTAIIADSAKLGVNVTIGAYTIIEDDVTIGDNTQIRNHCIIGKRTSIGSDNKIYNSAILGTDPQDLKYNGELTRTTIGDRNLIREFVTINNGTGENGHTIVGNDNCLLSYCHIAHDDHFGNGIIMSNTVQLAGHVIIEDGVVFGGLAAVHQFCKVGKFTMIAAGAIIVKDATPYSLIGREPAHHGINRIGLSRRGFSNELMKEISRFYIMVFKSGMNNSDGIKKYISEMEGNIYPEMEYCIKFIQESDRGVIR